MSRRVLCFCLPGIALFCLDAVALRHAAGSACCGDYARFFPGSGECGSDRQHHHSGPTVGRVRGDGAKRLPLYEDALKQSPADHDLEQRAEWSKLHYDLGRRYNDITFRDSLASMPVRDALEQYSEVLLKIQSHYVEKPNWQGLANHGTSALEAALSDNVFVERNLPGVPQARIDHFRRSLRMRLAGRPIETRQGVVDNAAAAARLASQELRLSESATVTEYTCGATNSLDPYSAYLTAGQLNEVYSQIEGNFVGLGIELKAQDSVLLIVKVISGSPAERGGMRAGDRIIAVDGRSMRELSTDQAANMLQGKDGSMVDVTIVTPGTAARVLRLRREQVEIPSVTNVKIVDADLGVGFLQLTCFQKTTSRDLDAALWKLHRLGMRSLIMDLRGNPGGLLTTSVDVVDKFVEKGVIVSTRGRSSQEDYNYTAQERDLADAAGRADRRRQRQCQRDLRRSHSRPSPRPDRGYPQLWQGLGAGNLPLEPFQCRTAAHDGEVLLA